MVRIIKVNVPYFTIAIYLIEHIHTHTHTHRERERERIVAEAKAL